MANDQEPPGWAGKLPTPQQNEVNRPRARAMRSNQTRAERKLWAVLRKRQRGLKFRRQHPIGHYIVDFYCPSARLVIEVDGPTHDHTYENDEVRQAYLESLGLQIVRFTNETVLNHIASVTAAIDALLPTPPNPIP